MKPGDRLKVLAVYWAMGVLVGLGYRHFGVFGIETLRGVTIFACANILLSAFLGYKIEGPANRFFDRVAIWLEKRREARDFPAVTVRTLGKARECCFQAFDGCCCYVCGAGPDEDCDAGLHG